MFVWLESNVNSLVQESQTPPFNQGNSAKYSDYYNRYVGLFQKEVGVLYLFMHFFSKIFFFPHFFQVWAVGEDRGLYFRMGVTASEPSGNGWIPVSAQWGNNKEIIPPRSGGI